MAGSAIGPRLAETSTSGASYCFQPTPLGSRVPIGTEEEIIGVDRLTLRVRPVAKEART